MKTPKIGQTMHYYPQKLYEGKGFKSEPVAAMVTAIVFPGVVDLTLFPPGSMPYTSTMIEISEEPSPGKVTWIPVV